MLTKIDWISFSVKTEVTPDATEKDALFAFASSLVDLHPQLPQWLGLDTQLTPGNGRAPYRTSWKPEAGGITVFTHPMLNHALVELSGRGCDNLADTGVLESVLRAVQERVTRLDIACDMLTDVRPLEFVNGRHEGRFKAVSHVISESGETFYVGSRSSDRYARVYRYNPPHERSRFLRSEFVVKQENAKILASTLLVESLEAVVAAFGETFGWRHPVWELGASPAEIAAYRPDRREGKTLYWLADTIAPLLVRLHNEGVIDVDLWLQDNVKAKIKR